MAITSGVWLSRWLLFVSIFRVMSTYWGYLKPGVIAERVFDLTTGPVTKTTTHLFGVWTCLSAMIAIASALDLRNSALVIVCWLSFVLAFVFFGLEFWVYQTVSFQAFKMPAIVSGISIVWIALFIIAGGPAEQDTSHEE
eukprot:GHVQ01038675.1.p1 GENE.GHVQ01038675.1~~GHVQ01038675.1.p1  ORF type:complete len:140 (-),score=8.26 GHVQ01038675.1:714-1133(-)